MQGAIDFWHSLLRSDVELSAPFWEALAARMRDEHLTFGGRLNCPFLRPLFLSPADLARVRAVSEVVARVGERVVAAAMQDRTLLDELGLSEPERMLADLDPGYATASTASRLDSFLLPHALSFAEYNAESPAGLTYTEGLSEVFDSLDVMARFRARYRTEHFHLTASMLDALVAAGHLHHRLARRADLGGIPEHPGAVRAARRADGRRRPA
jgi:hypothetical protein